MQARTNQDRLRQQWNSGSKLKTAVRRLSTHGISKQEVVDFFRSTAHKIGYSGSLPVPQIKGRKPTRDEVIREYSAVVGGFFGPNSTYADWKGTSVNTELVKHGYEPLAEITK